MNVNLRSRKASKTWESQGKCGKFRKLALVTRAIQFENSSFLDYMQQQWFFFHCVPSQFFRDFYASSLEFAPPLSLLTANCFLVLLKTW